MRADCSDWLRALLGGWAERLAGCEVETGPPWCLQRVAEGDALPVRVQVDDGIRVRIAEWDKELAIDDDGMREAADLVAAALFGRVAAEVHRVGEKWVRCRVELRVGDRWIEIANTSRTRLALWKRPVIARLHNDFAPPPGVRLQEGGALPYAPWVGILAHDEEKASARELPVDGELDLHPFQPREVAAVVRAYIDACLERGVYELRLVHGKGIGNLRRTVHALLDKHPAVAGYRLGGSGGGSWGATVVDLKRPTGGG
jgi:hypothetical protein